MSLLEYNIMKARHGRYADTAENRRLNRVGQEYGHAAKEDPEAAKTGGKADPESGKEKRTYDTARKELSTVLSNKEEFIKKYGQDEFDKRVGALVGEARELRDTEHKAEADKDFEAAKQPPKPKDTRSKKEKRTERLTKYKEQLKKVQEKMNQEGESEESRKMGEALEAKWKAKIEKLEAKVNRGQKKEKASPSEQNKKEFEAKLDQALKDGKISQEDYDSYKKDLGDAFKKEAEAVEAGKSSQDFWDEMNSELDEKMEKGEESEKSEIDPNMSMKKLDAAVDKELDDVLSAEGVHNDSPEWRKGAYDVYKRYKEVFPNKKAFKNGGNFDSRYSGAHHDAAQGFKMHAYIDARDKGLSHEQAEKEAQEAWANWQTDWHYTNDLLRAVRPDWGGEEGWDTDWREKKVSKEFDVDGQKVNVDISVKYKPGQGTYYEVSHNASGPLSEKLNNINSKKPDYAHDVMRQVNDAISGKED